MDQEFWEKEFETRGAYWRHDGDSKRPHALLTSDNHSNGFFNGSKIICDPLLLEHVCKAVLVGFSCPLEGYDWVIGSASGATTIPHEIAKRLGSRTGFTEKVLKPITLNLLLKTSKEFYEAFRRREEYSFQGEHDMVLKRFDVLPKEKVLVVEDVLTTGKTTQKTIKAIESRGAIVVDRIVVIVNRSGKTHLSGRKIIALIDEEMPIWTPEECPLCKQGSKAVRPKESWDLLTKEYEEV